MYAFKLEGSDDRMTCLSSVRDQFCIFFCFYSNICIVIWMFFSSVSTLLAACCKIKRLRFLLMETLYFKAAAPETKKFVSLGALNVCSMTEFSNMENNFYW